MHAARVRRAGGNSPPSSRRNVVAVALPPNLTITFFRYPKSLSGIVCHCGCGNVYCGGCGGGGGGGGRHEDLLVDDGSSRYMKAIYTFIKLAAPSERVGNVMSTGWLTWICCTAP